MTPPFSTDRTKLGTAITALQRDWHAFQLNALRVSARPSEKRTLLDTVSAAINSIDSDDFGVRVLLVKTLK